MPPSHEKVLSTTHLPSIGMKSFVPCFDFTHLKEELISSGLSAEKNHESAQYGLKLSVVRP